MTEEKGFKFKIGDKIRIKGTIKFGQDFSFWKGSFKDTVFTIYTINSNYGYELIGNGYGIVEGNYGNGSIYVSKEFETRFRKERSDD